MLENLKKFYQNYKSYIIICISIISLEIFASDYWVARYILFITNLGVFCLLLDIMTKNKLIIEEFAKSFYNQIPLFDYKITENDIEYIIIAVCISTDNNINTDYKYDKMILKPYNQNDKTIAFVGFYKKF
jgi:hypothetical protein